MILRPSRLAIALATNELSEDAKLRYLLLSTLFGLLAGQRVAAPLPRWEGIHLLYLGLTALITVVGVLGSFRANAAGDNQRFIERFVCLTSLLTIAIYGLFYLLYFGAGIALKAKFGRSAGFDAWYAREMSLVYSVVTLVIYFLWLRRLMRRASGAVSNPRMQPTGRIGPGLPPGAAP